MVIIIAASSGMQRNTIEITVRCYAMGVAAAVDSHTGLPDFEMLAELLVI